MDFQACIYSIKKMSGMKNKDIVNYVKDGLVECSPSQITKLSKGTQTAVDYELGDAIAKLHLKVSRAYYDINELAEFGADFTRPPLQVTIKN